MFPDVETNPGPRRPVPQSADYSVVMCGACQGTLVIWPWRRLSMTYCWALRLWPLICVTCRSCWFPDFIALSCCAGVGCLGHDRWRHTNEMDMKHFEKQSLSVVVAKCSFFMVCGVRQNLYVLSLYHNPDLDDRIFDHKSSWCCSLWLANCVCCDQLDVGPTHAHGGTLDLLMTDVLDLVRVSVAAPIGNSDHSTLSAVISMAQAVPNLCVSRKVFLKHQVNWNTVCGAMQDLAWRVTFYYYYYYY